MILVDLGICYLGTIALCVIVCKRHRPIRGKLCRSLISFHCRYTLIHDASNYFLMLFAGHSGFYFPVSVPNIDSNIKNLDEILLFIYYIFLK